MFFACQKCGKIHNDKLIPKYCSGEPKKERTVFVHKPHKSKYIYVAMAGEEEHIFEQIGEIAAFLGVDKSKISRNIGKKIQEYDISRRERGV